MNIIVIDTETACGFDNPLTYDIGYSISDEKENVLVERHYVVSEIFFNLEIFQTAYYADKRPLYLDRIEKGEIKVENFMNIRLQLLMDIINYSVVGAYAYNMAFDKRALNKTIQYITKDKNAEFFPKNFKLGCIYNMATIFATRNYRNFCENNGCITEKGNYSSSAETVYKYLTDDTEFCEHHMGLDDVQIERTIYYKVKSRHIKYDDTIAYNIWTKFQPN